MELLKIIRVKEELIRLGHIFKSDTDSEVIAHLLESYYAKLKGY